MNSQHSQPDAAASGIVALPATAGTVVAPDLRVQLVTAIDANDTVEIDASEVEMVGQAVLQLLVAAQNEVRNSGKECRIVNPSSAFSERVNECHLADRIGMNLQQDEE